MLVLGMRGPPGGGGAAGGGGMRQRRGSGWWDRDAVTVVPAVYSCRPATARVRVLELKKHREAGGRRVGDDKSQASPA